MPVVNVRMEEVPSGSREILRLSLEAENQSRVKVRRVGAWVYIEEHEKMAECELRDDWLRVDAGAGIGVLRTKKLEPKELLQGQVLYRWGKKPLIRCVLSFRYDSWLCRVYLGRPDRRSVVKWFVNPTVQSAEPPSRTALHTSSSNATQ